MMVTLGKLLRQLCALTPLGKISLSEDLPLSKPLDLMYIDYHEPIRFTIYPAATFAGLSPKGASAFAAWLAELCTGLPTGFADEDAILQLYAAFREAACDNPDDPNNVTRVCLLDSWDEWKERLPAFQRGVAAAFRKAKQLWGWRR
jgi:hypothetical protein